MSQPPGLYWVDAHEDLACHCQEFKRDIVDPGQTPCMITLPWLLQTGVRLVFGTFFVPHTLPAETRRATLEGQYEMYESWFARYPEALRPVRRRADLQALAQAEPVENPGTEGALAYPVGLLFLMEGCDLLESPAELELWHQRGLRMAGLTWNGTNRYASGCFSDSGGLTSLGRELLTEFERLGVVLDLAHLTDQGIADVFEHYHGPICATHSNARLLCHHERNLTDEQAKEIARRGGVIGLNLLATFLKTGWHHGMPLPDVGDALEHVEHFADLCGMEHVGLGSDLDGGLTPENTPLGIDRVSEIQLLADGLAERGWSTAQIAGFAGANWWAFLERCLPE